MRRSKPALSLATATDAHLFRSIGRVKERETHIIFSSPDIPSYRWGNRIHLMMPEACRAVAGCEKLMTEELSEVCHNAFSFDVGAYEEFPEELWRSHGYEVDFSDTLVLRERPEGQSGDFSVRPLVTNLDWHQALECQVLVSTWGKEAVREYLTPKFQRYRSLSGQGDLVWFGAFLPCGTQVGNLGILLSQDLPPLARFQMVATHPQYQGRGVCKTLLQSAIHYIFNSWRPGETPQVVIAADPHYHAKRIYQSIGFMEHEYQVFVTKTQ